MRLTWKGTTGSALLTLQLGPRLALRRSVDAALCAGLAPET